MSISNNHYDFKTVSDLIALDHIKEALTKMTEYTKLKAYTKLNNETVQCLSRFSKNENDKNMGIICDLTYSKEHTQIQNAVISLNDNILNYDTLKKEETKRKCQIQVIINGKLENFTPEDKLKFKNILAATLDIDPDLVSILEVKEGSIKLTIELPSESAEKLVKLFRKKDIALDQFQINFEIKDVKRVVTIEKSSIVEKKKNRFADRRILKPAVRRSTKLLKYQRNEKLKVNERIGYPKQMKILFIEDQQIGQKLISAILPFHYNNLLEEFSLEKITPVFAQSLNEAKDILNKSNQKNEFPSIIISDIQLIEGTGFDFLELFKNQFLKDYPKTVVALISACLLDEDKSQFANYPFATDILDKPLYEEQLKILIREYIKRLSLT